MSRCPPTRACMTCNPKAMYLEPKPATDSIACKNCGTRIPLTEYPAHLETCQPQGGMP